MMMLRIAGAVLNETEVSRFARRAEEERALASSTADPRAAKAHLDLAGQYDAVAAAYRQLAARDPTRR